MHRDDVNTGADGVLSVAPGEGQKPIAILTDPHFEEMCNPTKYPAGGFGLMANRERKLTVRKFFNQRLLDVDGRFTKDVEYLLTVQYAVESKQVADDASIVLRQSQGRQYRGQALTAGAVQNQSVLLQMIHRDDAYKFLKNVRGSPAYFQKVMYDVLAMIRQLGLPTWFFTLSAADMQWPDVIQTIAKQYGSTFSDEEVAAMSFEEKSKWLSHNPVTAARHFQYRLNTFVQKFLKSKAHPLGELTDYSIRVEFQARGSPHAHSMLWIKGAPKLGVNTDQEVCDFIDRYIRCDVPEDDEVLALLVSKVQKHRHSPTCRRNGSCRFRYPRPPSPATVVARENNPDLCSAEEAKEVTAALLKVRKTLDHKDTPVRTSTRPASSTGMLRGLTTSMTHVWRSLLPTTPPGVEQILRRESLATHSHHLNQRAQEGVHAFSSRMGSATCTSAPEKPSSASTDSTKRRKPASCTVPS